MSFSIPISFGSYLGSWSLVAGASLLSLPSNYKSAYGTVNATLSSVPAATYQALNLLLVGTYTVGPGGPTMAGYKCGVSAEFRNSSGGLIGTSGTQYFAGDGANRSVNLSIIFNSGQSNSALNGAYFTILISRPFENPLSGLSGAFLLSTANSSLSGSDIPQQGSGGGAGDFKLFISAPGTQMANREVTVHAEVRKDDFTRPSFANIVGTITPSHAGAFHNTGNNSTFVSANNGIADLVLTISPSFLGAFTVTVASATAVDSPKIATITAVPYVAAPQAVVNGANQWLLSGVAFPNEIEWSVPEGFIIEPYVQAQTGVTLQFAAVPGGGVISPPTLVAGPSGVVGLRAAGATLLATLTDASNTKALTGYHYLFRYPDTTLISDGVLAENLARDATYEPFELDASLAMMEG